MRVKSLDINLTVSWEGPNDYIFQVALEPFVIGYILCHPLIIFHLIWKNNNWLVFTIYVKCALSNPPFHLPGSTTPVPYALQLHLHNIQEKELSSDKGT